MPPAAPAPAPAPTTFTAAWDIAKTQCMAGLSTEDQKLFQFTTADDARVAIKDAQSLYDKDHKHGAVWQAVNSFLNGVENYGKAIDVFVSTAPLFLAPVWGTVRVFIKALGNFEDYITKVLLVFGEIGDNLSRFQVYGKVFPTEAGVQAALVKIYVETLRFCIGARHVFMLRGGKKGNLILRPFRDHAFKALWQPFEEQFKSTVSNFQRYKMLVEDEVRAASAKAATTHYDRSLKEYAESKDARDRHGQADEETRRRRLFTWLKSSPKNQDAYHTARKLRHNGTCQWLMQHPTFLKWSALSAPPKTPAGMLWVTAIPGRGKTIVCGRLVEHFKSHSSSDNVVYFFCSRSDQDLNTSSYVARGLVSQMLAADRNNGAIYNTILKEYDQSEAELAATSQSWSLLRQVSQQHTTFVIIDGFDECIDQNALLIELKHLAKSAHVVVFSRSMSSVWPKEFTAFTMDINDRDVAADISAMVKERLDSSSIMSALHPIVRSELEKNLIKKADGMFLWIRLVLEQLDDLATFKEVQEHIERTPSNVSAIYRTILEGFLKLPQLQQTRIMRVLRWTVASRRPLHIREVSDAIVLKASSSRILAEDRILQIERVLHQCDPLLHVNPDTHTVHLCHYSLKEFFFQLTSVEAQQLQLLESDDSEIRSGVSEELGKLSLRYLALEDLPSDWDVDDAKVTERFPLLRYATDHWLEHILEAPATTTNVRLVDEFLQTTAAAVWMKNFISLRKQQFGRRNAGSHLVGLQKGLSSWRAGAGDDASRTSATPDAFGDLMMKQYLLLQQKSGPQDPAALEIGFDLCEHHSWMGRTEFSEELLISFLRGKPEPSVDDNDQESIQRLRLWLELSNQYMMNGKLVEAKALAKKVFEARKKRLGLTCFETCEAAALLADICTDLGILDEAEDMHRLALDGFVQSRGELDLDTLREFNNFGNCLKLMGKVNEAAPMLTKAYEGRRAHYGPKNQSTLRALDNLGTVLLDTGKVDEAAQAHETALEGMRELLGDDDVFTSRAATNLAAARAKAGDLALAIELATVAVVSLEKTVGTEHIDTLKAAALLGAVLRQSKDIDLAIPVLQRTSRFAVDTLGKTHYVAEACEKELKALQLPVQNLKKNYHNQQKSYVAILGKRPGVQLGAMTMLQRYRTVAVGVTVLVLLIAQVIFRTRFGWRNDTQEEKLTTEGPVAEVPRLYAGPKLQGTHDYLGMGT